jgi:hypothetical protein
MLSSRIGLKIGHEAAVEQVQHLVVELVVPNLVQQVNKSLVALAVNMLELDGNWVGLPQCLAPEKIGSIVVLPQHVPLLLLHHGGQLVEVANHQQLHPAEGLGMVPVAAQHLVHGVEEVGPHHADFVNHEQVEAFDEADFLPRKTPLFVLLTRSAGQVQPERQLEHGVQGHAPGVDGGHPSRGRDDHALESLVFDSVEKSSLASASLARQVNILVGVADVIEGQVELRVCE